MCSFEDADAVAAAVHRSAAIEAGAADSIEAGAARSIEAARRAVAFRTREATKLIFNETNNSLRHNNRNRMFVFLFL